MLMLFAVLVFLFVYLLLSQNAEAWTLRGEKTIATATTNYPYSDFIQMSGRTWGVPTALIRAVIRTESNFNPDVVSSKKCYGLMQVGLGTAQDFGYVDDWRNPTDYEISKIMNPQNNINIGTRELSHLLGTYPFDTAIQMYNVGVDGYLNHGYRAAGYLAKVKGYYDGYSK